MRYLKIKTKIFLIKSDDIRTVMMFKNKKYIKLNQIQRKHYRSFMYDGQKGLCKNQNMNYSSNLIVQVP